MSMASSNKKSMMDTRKKNQTTGSFMGLRGKLNAPTKPAWFLYMVESSTL
jgi:hypothetical protein